MAAQNKDQKIAKMEADANIMKIEAKRKLEVGQAEINKEVITQNAEAQKIKFTTEAEGEANKIKTIGEAEANIIKVKNVADADGTLKQAEALKQFDNTAINVKILDIQKDIMLGKFTAFATALSKANIKWIISGANAQKLFGINLDAEGGANLQQFIDESGLDLTKLIETLKGKTEKK